ncbi:MAG: hypothetical protein IJD17_01360, partial [Clostridia bacterium]|nr:hypothetical protein [Clostridia bacterium]
MKRFLIMLLCAIMVISCFCLSACNEKENNKNDDTAPETGRNSGAENPFADAEKIAPVDVSKIEKGKGGDIVGKWFSADMVYEIKDQNEQTQQFSYNIIFIFNEDGTSQFAINLIEEEEPYKDATYSVDGGKLIIEGEGL